MDMMILQLVQNYNWTNGLGYLYLIWGGDTITWDRSLTFTRNVTNDYFGESVANIGDINNDGFEDISYRCYCLVRFVMIQRKYISFTVEM